MMLTDLIVPCNAHVAILALRVVLAVLTDSSTGLSTCSEHSGVVVTLVSVVVAVTFLALVLHFASSRSPGNVLIEILAALTVVTSE